MNESGVNTLSGFKGIVNWGLVKSCDKFDVLENNGGNDKLWDNGKDKNGDEIVVIREESIGILDGAEKWVGRIVPGKIFGQLLLEEAITVIKELEGRTGIVEENGSSFVVCEVKHDVGTRLLEFVSDIYKEELFKPLHVLESTPPGIVVFPYAVEEFSTLIFWK